MLLDTASDFGIILTVKHLLILAVIAIGFLIGLVAVPKLRRSAPPPGSSPSGEFLKANRSLLRLSMISTIAGVGIMLCAAFLW